VYGSVLALKLHCINCDGWHAVDRWPLNGDRVPMRFQASSKPGAHVLDVRCPHCGGIWYVAWDEYPGPVERVEVPDGIPVAPKDTGLLGAEPRGATRPTDELLADLEHNVPGIRWRAASELVAMGGDAVPEVAPLLWSPEQQMQVRAARILGRLGPAAAGAVPSLVRCTDHQAPMELRRACAWALGRVGDPSAGETLHRLLADPEADVREAARVALARMGWPPATPVAWDPGNVVPPPPLAPRARSYAESEDARAIPPGREVPGQWYPGHLMNAITAAPPFLPWLGGSVAVGANAVRLNGWGANWAGGMCLALVVTAGCGTLYGALRGGLPAAATVGVPPALVVAATLACVLPIAMAVTVRRLTVDLSVRHVAAVVVDETKLRVAMVVESPGAATPVLYTFRPADWHEGQAVLLVALRNVRPGLVRDDFVTFRPWVGLVVVLLWAWVGLVFAVLHFLGLWLAYVGSSSP